MSATRRMILKSFAAALAVPALPPGFQAPAPHALAAKAGAVAVLDNGEAEQEIVAREQWQLLARPDDGTGVRVAQWFLERFADGSANLVFETKRPLDFKSPTFDQEMDAEIARFVANPVLTTHTVSLSAPMLADLDQGMIA